MFETISFGASTALLFQNQGYAFTARRADDRIIFSVRCTQALNPSQLIFKRHQIWSYVDQPFREDIRNDTELPGEVRAAMLLAFHRLCMLN